MKIGIIGTRGIPNHYGGFEQFAEQVAVRWVEMGHEVAVYNSHNHPFQDKAYKGVQIIHCFDPEYKLGTAGQFIYDLNCVMDSRKQNFDIFLQLGYTSSSIWSFLMPKKSVVVTNMDGLEWKRTKYSAKVQKFLRLAERWGIDGSDALVADSIGIQEYLRHQYNVSSEFIAYGADVLQGIGTDLLPTYQLTPKTYHLIIARLEPENSIDVLLEGFTLSNSDVPMVVVGNHQTEYGEYLKKKYAAFSLIRFLGAIYDATIINQLRANCYIYFHGHTVGGTNPSLIEAMGCGAFICANHNVFNQSVLLTNALYFSDTHDVRDIINKDVDEPTRVRFIEANKQRVLDEYNWNKIALEYLGVFKRCLE